MIAIVRMAVSVLLTLAPLEAGAPLPDLSGDALDGRTVELPAAARGRVTLLVFGFTHGSGHAVEAWGTRFRAAYSADSLGCWEVPVFGGMAKLAAPMIRGGMRKGTAPALRPYVVLVWSDSGRWKQRLGYRGPNDAYVVLLDREGRVRWRHSGPCDDAAWRDCTAAADALR